MTPRRPERGIDALLPAEIAEKAEAVGAEKTRLDSVTLAVLAMLAGAFIALGALFATTVLAGAHGAVPYGISHFLASSGLGESNWPDREGSSPC